LMPICFLKIAKRTSPPTIGQSGRKSNGRLLWQPQRLIISQHCWFAFWLFEPHGEKKLGRTGRLFLKHPPAPAWPGGSARLRQLLQPKSPPVRDCSSHICMPYRGCSSAAPRTAAYLPRQFWNVCLACVPTSNPSSPGPGTGSAPIWAELSTSSGTSEIEMCLDLGRNGQGALR